LQLREAFGKKGYSFLPHINCDDWLSYGYWSV
jgi:hypothetical protein